MKSRAVVLLLFLVSVIVIACTGNKNDKEAASLGKSFKGLYSLGPEVKTFTDCYERREYWVVDSAKKLELEYSKFNFEKPYEPVYIEIEGYLRKSDSTELSSDYDSTLVVKKVIKITKEIPEGPCNQ